jgi:hypothetical protein
LLKIAQNVRSKHEATGGILLDINQGQMFTLNLVGSRILQMLEDGVDEPQIVQQLSLTFQIRPDILANDVHEFIECLHKHGLLERLP